MEFITNRDGSLRDVLYPLINSADQIDICVAHITERGAKMLLEMLRNQKVRIVTGTDFCLTECEALRILTRDSRCEVRRWCKSESETFHPKIYIIHYHNGGKAIVGSSNLSEGAWTNNWEANVILDLQDEIGKYVVEYFEHIWNMSEEVDEDFLEDYCQIAARAREKAIEIRIAREINLGRRRLEQIPIEAGEPQYWLIIYRHPNSDVCAKHHVISFPEGNPRVMKKFQKMRIGDYAIAKDAGGEVKYVWQISSNIFPNPHPDEPWKSEGTLDGKKFRSLREIRVLECLRASVKLTQILGNKDYQSGLVRLSKDEFEGLYRAATDSSWGGGEG